ncbi:Nucleolar protein 12, partial [Dispira simplex]
MDNLSALTQGSALYAKKRQFKKNQVQAIKFDQDSRKEFLTGFSKRKKERKRKAEEKRAEREKEERRELRKERKRNIQARIEENIAQQRAYFGIEDGEDQGQDDSRDSSAEQPDVTEYQTPDTLTTVTVVSELDVDSLRGWDAPVQSSRRQTSDSENEESSNTTQTSDQL